MRVVHHDGAVPVEGHKSPCQRAGDGRGVDEARVGVVAEVQRSKVEEVEDEKDLSPDEVVVDEEEDESRVQDVVGDEVATHGAGGVDSLDVGGEEVGYIADLEDEEGEP